MNRSALLPWYYGHGAKNCLLLLLSFIALPVSSTLVIFAWISGRLCPLPKPLLPKDGDETKKTILVTGVSMSKGLVIARSLARNTQHRIIGADISSASPGRFSNALTKYFTLTKPNTADSEPYVDSLLSVMKAEKVDMWISCSSVVAANEDGEVVHLADRLMGPDFVAIQFREDVVEILHEKDRFIEYISSLGLTTPESYRCTSVDETLKVLFRMGSDMSSGKKFLLKPIGVDDKARNKMMTKLPLIDVQQTRAHVEQLAISPSSPFQLQQFIKGNEYCSHALVIRGQVMAFTACPSSELLMHYEALPESSPLFQQMLTFTKRVALQRGDSFTGHLSFDFLSDQAQADDDSITQLFPIECNPRAHTAVVLLADTPRMASAYLTAFRAPTLVEGFETVVPQIPARSYYWMGHDLIVLLLLPLLDILCGHSQLGKLIEDWSTFFKHILYWRDGTFCIWDPLPFLILYHIYWPMQFFTCLISGKHWSRINVSTTKMFEV